MPWVVKDGMAEWFDWDSDALDGTSQWYGTLAGAVAHAGVQATAFAHPCKAETLYDAHRALTERLWVPVGVMLDYRIAAIPNRLVLPPCSAADITQTQGAS
jgi:hypothetical protein